MLCLSDFELYPRWVSLHFLFLPFYTKTEELFVNNIELTRMRRSAPSTSSQALDFNRKFLLNNEEWKEFTTCMIPQSINY